MKLTQSTGFERVGEGCFTAVDKGQVTATCCHLLTGEQEAMLAESRLVSDCMIDTHDSLLVRAPSLSKDCEFDSRQVRRKIFLLQSQLCMLSFSVRSTPLLPQWYVKDPDHSVKNAGSRLHLNMHTPLIQRSRSGLIMPLSRHSVGTYLEMSSCATCQGIFSHSLLSLLSHVD